MKEYNEALDARNIVSGLKMGQKQVLVFYLVLEPVKSRMEAPCLSPKPTLLGT